MSRSGNVMDLSRFVFPKNYTGERLILMLEAYLDESKMAESGKRIFTVGGCLADDTRWKEFVPRWEGVLAKFDLPYFRTSEYEARRGLYEGWTNDKRLDLIVSLTDVARSATRLAIANVLVVSDLETLSDDERAFVGDHYDFCGSWAMFLVSNFLKLKKEAGEVSYMFELGGEGWGLLERTFSRAKRNDVEKHLRLMSIAKGDPIEFPQLQAADLWAFEAGKEALREIGAHDRDIRKSFDAMFNGENARGYLFDRELLKRTVAGGFRPLHYPTES